MIDPKRAIEVLCDLAQDDSGSIYSQAEMLGALAIEAMLATARFEADDVAEHEDLMDKAISAFWNATRSSPHARP